MSSHLQLRNEDDSQRERQLDLVVLTCIQLVRCNAPLSEVL